MSKTPIIISQGITKQFKDNKLTVDVLKGIDLSVNPAERIAIVGSSGSGKSTLLHILGGLDLPSSGSITIQGKNIAQLSDNQRGLLRNQSLGFIYQFHHLLAEFTALENVAMPLLIQKNTSVEEAQTRANDILIKVGLDHRLNHKPSQLSGGERQRAAIARALVNNPRALLADEPTGNLDQKTANKVFELMQSLNEQLETAFIIVTHDLELAKKMDKTYQLTDGYLHPM